MKTKQLFLFILAAALLFLSACGDDDDGITITQIKTFVSVGANDGIIVNAPTRVVKDYYAGSQGYSITIGWDGNGSAMRGFLSFDVSSIIPSSDKTLVIDEARLRTYEANTNLNPFNASGIRTVNCYLVNYGTLDISDYDMPPIADCGVMAHDGFNVLEEHALNVTQPLNGFVNDYPAEKHFQFRLQFIPDENVAPLTKLSSAMWNIFSGDETSKVKYRPTLEIKYHYKKK